MSLHALGVAMDEAFCKMLATHEKCREGINEIAQGISERLPKSGSSVPSGNRVTFNAEAVWRDLRDRLIEHGREHFLPAGMTVHLHADELAPWPGLYAAGEGVFTSIAGRIERMLGSGGAQALAGKQAARLVELVFKERGRQTGETDITVRESRGRFIIQQRRHSEGWFSRQGEQDRVADILNALATLIARAGEQEIGQRIMGATGEVAHDLENGFTSRQEIDVAGVLVLRMFKERIEYCFSPDAWEFVQIGRALVEQERKSSQEAA